MKRIFKIITMLCIASTSLTSCAAQVKNAKTVTTKIYGNCSICEKAIETAGNDKKTAKIDWNKDTKLATFIFDSTQTNQQEILKRIALAGYDSDEYLAPDNAYNKLLKCCQYDRVNKTASDKMVAKEVDTTLNETTPIVLNHEENQLIVIFDNYFEIKDALVKSDKSMASSIAQEMLNKINSIKMEDLTSEEHSVWMTELKGLKSNTDIIFTSTSIEKQRKAFMDLSSNIYKLIKVSKLESPIYYQNCPMYNDGKGANWLSRENTITNPYYGSQMITCGKTIETIK
jgi:hypothetical protein